MSDQENATVTPQSDNNDALKLVKECIEKGYTINLQSLTVTADEANKIVTLEPNKDVAHHYDAVNQAVIAELEFLDRASEVIGVGYPIVPAELVRERLANLQGGAS